MNFDRFGNGPKPHAGIGRPVDAGDPSLVERHRFIQRPTRRLDDAAFCLIADSIGVDNLAAVDCSNSPNKIYGIRTDRFYRSNTAITLYCWPS